jgi:hypothetical protein
LVHTRGATRLGARMYDIVLRRANRRKHVWAHVIAHM